MKLLSIFYYFLLISVARNCAPKPCPCGDIFSRNIRNELNYTDVGNCVLSIKCVTAGIAGYWNRTEVDQPADIGVIHFSAYRLYANETFDFYDEFGVICDSADNEWKFTKYPEGLEYYTTSTGSVTIHDADGQKSVVEQFGCNQ